MTVVINIIGVGRRSGKTTLVETITRTLSKRFTIWTVKHISSSFDTAEKDTWRHLHAGAKAVIAVTRDETVTIKKSVEASLEAVLDEVPENVDLLLVEGFRKSSYPKIIAARKIEDAKEVLSAASQVLAIYGVEAAETNGKTVEGIQVLKLEALISKIEEMILTDITGRLPGLNCRSCGFPSCEALANAISKGEVSSDRCKVILEEAVDLRIDGKHIFLSPFPREFVRNTVLGMVSSLKGTSKNELRHLRLEIRA